MPTGASSLPPYHACTIQTETMPRNDARRSTRPQDKSTHKFYLSCVLEVFDQLVRAARVGRPGPLDEQAGLFPLHLVHVQHPLQLDLEKQKQ